MLVYGRLPRGPLAVLKESWTDQRDVSADLGKPVGSYITELRARLKKAADWAELHARHGQEVFTHNHNLRSRDKRFDEGDKVIVLDDDAAGKLCKRWQGPATVVRVISPDSYFIDINDGRVRHVHASIMCKFHVHVQSCDIISADDVDFCRVLVPATVESDMLPSVNVDRSGIEHIDPEQQVELLALLGEFAAGVSDEPNLCGVCGVWLLFVFLVCEMVKLPWLFGTVVVLFWKLVSASCLLLCATVCELRTRRNSQVLEIADCVFFERVDYLSYLSLSWCIESGVVYPLLRSSGMGCVDYYYYYYYYY